MQWWISYNIIYTSLSRATKFILNDLTSNYKTRLVKLNLLPLMMTLELNDIFFFIKNYQNIQDYFNIKTWFKFSSVHTRSSTANKLTLSQRKPSFHHPFLDKFPRLWNALPPLDLSFSFSSLKRIIKTEFQTKFLTNFNSDNPCTFHFACPCYYCSTLPLPKHFVR